MNVAQGIECASGELRGWSLVTGAPLPLFAPAPAGVSALVCADAELLCGTQEGGLLAYPLDPRHLYGRGARDGANWAHGDGPSAIGKPAPRALVAHDGDDDAVPLD